MTVIPILIVGTGPMGQAILSTAGVSAEYRVLGMVTRGKPGNPGSSSVPMFSELSLALEKNPRAVVLDFSGAHGAADRVATIAAAGFPLVQGTTGLDTGAHEALKRAGTTVAVVHAPNTSLGMALVRRGLMGILGHHNPDWEVTILDRHHRMKRDAPSGTAKMLQETIQALRGGAAPEVASFRQGSVPGEHTVYLSGPDEEITLTHRAFNRGVFARGALLAARFALQSGPGMYTMDDVVKNTP